MNLKSFKKIKLKCQHKILIKKINFIKTELNEKNYLLKK